MSAFKCYFSFLFGRVSKFFPKFVGIQPIAMNNTLAGIPFPGFDYTAEEITRFKETIEFFSLMLKDGQVIHYTPLDIDDFRNWLLQNAIPDVAATCAEKIIAGVGQLSV